MERCPSARASSAPRAALVAAVALALTLVAPAHAASFDAARFARDAQADLVSAKARRSGIHGGKCTVVSRARVRCIVIAPAYAGLTGGGPRVRVEFRYANRFLYRTAYTSDGIPIGGTTKCRFITYAGFARHCDS